MEASPRVGDVVDVEIEKLVFGGEGFARHLGRALFVPFTAAGEHLRVRITRVERSWARGVVEAVSVASASRRAAPCAHFGRCGGCQLQHLDVAAQLSAKADFVREALRRTGKIEWESDIEVLSAGELGYRSRAELQIERDGASVSGIGYFASGSRRVTDVDSCPILAPELERELLRLRAEREGIPADARSVHLAAGNGQVSRVFVDADENEVAGQGEVARVTQRVAGFDLRFDARSFFQSNRLLADRLVDVAVGESRGTLVIELYSGVGFFSLPLARRFAAVLAVEESSAASQSCADNARANGVANLKCEASSVEEWLDRRAKKRSRPDLVFLDPPRSGAGRRVIDGILRLEPKTITYVSCDPTTLARDLRLFVDLDWHIESIEALDMFPQTFHVETVARLRRDMG
jgi:23S rRNA (uracil1939-C5)-methyltransferase